MIRLRRLFLAPSWLVTAGLAYSPLTRGVATPWGAGDRVGLDPQGLPGDERRFK